MKCSSLPGKGATNSVARGNAHLLAPESPVQRQVGSRMAGTSDRSWQPRKQAVSWPLPMLRILGMAWLVMGVDVLMEPYEGSVGTGGVRRAPTPGDWI